MPDLLQEIYRGRRRHLELEMAREPLAELEARAQSAALGRRSLRAALAAAQPPAVIAEVKRRSPSAGMIAAEAEPGRVAADYQAAGADAVSVLTEPDHFGGRLEDLGAVRAGCLLPVLRKDFLSTSYQVVQSAAHGADAILAIVAGLDDRPLAELLAAAADYRLEVLVEVHTRAELERALRHPVRLLGINNRDLSSLSVDLAITEELCRQVPPEVMVVSESGIQGRAEVERLSRSGVVAFLVGEALMRAVDRTSWIAAVKAPALSKG